MGFTAIINCVKKAILKLKIFFIIKNDKNTIPVPLIIEIILIVRYGSLKTVFKEENKTGPPIGAFGTLTFSLSPNRICSPAKK